MARKKQFSHGWPYIIILLSGWDCGTTAIRISPPLHHICNSISISIWAQTKKKKKSCKYPPFAFSPAVQGASCRVGLLRCFCLRRALEELTFLLEWPSFWPFPVPGIKLCLWGAFSWECVYCPILWEEPWAQAAQCQGPHCANSATFIGPAT